MQEQHLWSMEQTVGFNEIRTPDLQVASEFSLTTTPPRPVWKSRVI